MSSYDLGELARTLFEESGDALFLFDPDSERMLDVNGMAQRLSGFTRAELLQMPVPSLFRSENAEGLVRLSQAYRQTMPLPSQEGFWLRRRDANAWVAVNLTVAQLHAGSGTLGLIAARDISERRRAEEALRNSENRYRSLLKNLEQLRQSQKMEAVGQLAGGVAHDFNNLLTAILGNLSLIQSGLASGDPQRPLVDATERAAWRAATLTRQLLGFSRRTLLHPEPLNANHTVHEVVGLLKRAIDPRITLRTRGAADLWLVQADPNQMSQVLMNLCLNARDAVQPLLDGTLTRQSQEADGFADRDSETIAEGSPRTAVIELETANVVLAADDLHEQVQARPGEFVRLRVRDNGTGIAPEARAHIFEPFFTTKRPGKGTGLGLAMVFGIVQQHHGWIECHSVAGQGTRFDIYLPRHHAAVAPAPPPPLQCKPSGGHETILLVDDEALVRNLGRTILESFGYRILLANDGRQAIDIYQREHPHIDLILLDLTMPRLSGRDALRKLLDINADVRVLFASGYSAEHLSDDDHEHIYGFVNKPYRPEELAHAVRTALDHSLTVAAL